MSKGYNHFALLTHKSLMQFKNEIKNYKGQKLIDGWMDGWIDGS
jgi:hypothetical protein